MPYIDTGGNKPVLVLIHGLGGRKEAWSRQMVLANRYRLIIPDLRGHGDSPIITDISTRTLMEDVIGLLRHLGIEEAHFCGLSLGGAIVQEIMKWYPSFVLSTILANTTSIFPTYITSMTVRELGHTLAALDDDAFIEGICNRGLYNKHLIDEAKEGFNINRHTYLKISQSTVGKNYLPTIAMFNKPLMIITSSKDVVVPPQTSLLTYAFKPCATLKYFENCGHLSYIDRSDDFNEAIYSFLK